MDRVVERLLLFVIFALLNDVHQTQPCQRPDGTTGLCVSIDECPSVLSRSQGFVSPDDLDEFHSLSCDERTPTLVCCDQTAATTAIGIRDSVIRSAVGDDPVFPGKEFCGRDSLTNTSTMFDGKDSAYPWTALLEYLTTDLTKGERIAKFQCLGALITQRYVITPANCVFFNPVVNIRLGEYNLSTNPDCVANDCADPVLNVGVDRTFVHPEYHNLPRDFSYKIALLRLDRDVAYTKFISPICMPSIVGLVRSGPGTKLTAAAGWVLFGGIMRSSVKLKTQLVVANWPKCKELYGGLLDFDMSVMCAWNERPDEMCHEGVGSPVVLQVEQRWTIEGLSAGGAKCNQKSWPTLFTHVPYVEKWIRDTIEAVHKEENTSDFPTAGICGRHKFMTRTWGGVAAHLTDFPWMVLLQYQSNVTRELVFRCGGSLINHRYVLTAAQCIGTGSPNGGEQIVNVRLGEYDVRSDPDCNDVYCLHPVLDVGVEEIVVHPEYEPKLNDIALIRMSQYIRYTNYISPICMPWVVGLVPSKFLQGVTSSGWGLSRNTSMSPVKLRVNLPIFRENICKKIYTNIRDSHLCAGGNRDGDTCYGDPGGPLTVLKDKYWAIEGIVSFRNECVSEGWPAVFTRVSSYEDWIRSTLKQ